MTEQKMDLYDFRREMVDRGIDDEEALESLNNGLKKIHMLTFALDNKGVNIVSYLNGKITFVDGKFPGKVEVGDVWICSVTPNGKVNYAMPLYKITASFLINIEPRLKEAMIDSMWERHKDIFESDFAQKYKEEVHDSAIQEARAELGGEITALKAKVTELEDQLAQNRILSKTMSAVQNPQTDIIELGSEIEDVGCIELGSEIATANTEVQPVRVPSVPKIPRTYVGGSPGIPEIRIAEPKEPVPHMVFNVERIGEETLFSESFTDNKYFVHISPDTKKLTIRPNEYGNALCINRRIRLKGLNKLSPFTEQKKLTAEYDERYEGLLVYL